MIEFSLGTVFGVVISFLIARAVIRITVTRLQKEIESTLKEHVEEAEAKRISCRVEKMNDIFYIYNTDDDSFIAQGRTMDELRERVHARFKDTRVFVTEGEDDVINELKSSGSVPEANRA